MLLSARTGRTAHLARTAAGRAGLVALPPVMACAQRAYPDTAVTPIPPSADVSVPEQVARLRDLPDDAVIDDLARTFGPSLPTVWRPPADHPRAWLRSYASATSSAWSAVSPHWRSAEPLLALEARRVGAAVVRGCTDVLLNTLHPRIRYVDGEIRVPATRDQSVDLAGRKLVLVPTLAGPGGRLVGFDLPDVVYVVYVAYPAARPGHHLATLGHGTPDPPAGPPPSRPAAGRRPTDHDDPPGGNSGLHAPDDQLPLQVPRVSRPHPPRTPRPNHPHHPHPERPRTPRPLPRLIRPRRVPLRLR